MSAREIPLYDVALHVSSSGGRIVARMATITDCITTDCPPRADVILDEAAVRKVLADMADHAPELLHAALDDRMVRRIAEAVAEMGQS